MTHKQLTRFMMKVTPDVSGCWLWIASKKPGGYGQFGIDGVPRLSHRLAYEHFIGPIPADKEIDHLCRVRACVNPTHLQPVAHIVNAQRGVAGYKVMARNLSRWETNRDDMLKQIHSIAEHNRGRQHSAERRLKSSGWKHTDEARAKLRECLATGRAVMSQRAAERTTCRRGHERNADNTRTYVRFNQTIRFCRICHAENRKKYLREKDQVA